MIDTYQTIKHFFSLTPFPISIEVGMFYIVVKYYRVPYLCLFSMDCKP